MENEVYEILKRETAEIEAQLTRNIGSWLVMKEDYERWRRERREECGASVVDDDLEWERGSSVREFHQQFIAPLEEQLREKYESLELFRTRHEPRE